MRAEELWHHYPVLYHIAWGGSWPSIEKHGLLSTEALLRLYGKDEEEIAGLTRSRRGHWVPINCPRRPPAVLRDQKPMTDAGLVRALRGTAEPWQWYELINSMVFFWPTRLRLKTMITASAYEEVKHDVLVVDCETLVRLAGRDIRLSRMNSGCTKPMPHPRDMGLFKRLEDYSFPARPSPSVVAKAVAEVCVVDRVECIADAVLEVVRGSADDVLDAIGGA